MDTPGAGTALQFDADVLKHFESLGDNCEFGLVQVALGVDQLGFFRFNNSSFDAVLAVLENGFKDFADPQDIVLETACNNELIVFIPRYGFRYHTFQQAGEVDQHKLLAQQKLVLSWLARKALDDLRAGEKLFIRKEGSEVEAGKITRLYKTLQAYGPNRLLWVSCSEDREKIGRVEPARTLGQGAFIGYMDQFSQYEDARSFSYSWFDLCRAALSQAKGWPPASAAGYDGGGEAGKYVLRSLRDSASVCTTWDDGIVLKNALVHGPEGVVTVDKTVIEESLPAQWARRAKLDRVTGSRFITLPQSGSRVRLPAAYHLFCQSEAELCERYQDVVFKRFCAYVEARTPVTLLIAEREDFVVLETLRKLVHTRMPRLSVPQGASINVQHLLLPMF